MMIRAVRSISTYAHYNEDGYYRTNTETIRVLGLLFKLVLVRIRGQKLKQIECLYKWIFKNKLKATPSFQKYITMYRYIAKVMHLEKNKTNSC